MPGIPQKNKRLSLSAAGWNCWNPAVRATERFWWGGLRRWSFPTSFDLLSGCVVNRLWLFLPWPDRWRRNVQRAEQPGRLLILASNWRQEWPRHSWCGSQIPTLFYHWLGFVTEWVCYELNRKESRKQVDFTNAILYLRTSQRQNDLDVAACLLVQIQPVRNRLLWKSEREFRGCKSQVLRTLYLRACNYLSSVIRRFYS